MKKRLLILAIVPFFAYGDSALIESINKTLDQIQYESNQKPKVDLNVKYDPFYHDNTPKQPQVKERPTRVKKEKKDGLKLSMILNKKAFINGNWYSKNEKVAHYVLDKINQNSVVLKKKNKYLILKLETADNLLVKKEK